MSKELIDRIARMLKFCAISMLRYFALGDMRTYARPINVVKKISVLAEDCQRFSNQIKPFLIEWGAIGTSVRTHLTNLTTWNTFLNSVSPFLDGFRSVNINTLDFEQNEKDICKIYDQIVTKKNGIAATTLTKVWHLGCPDLFIPMDGPVEKWYSKNFSPKNGSDTYISYLKDVKQIIEKANMDEENIEVLPGLSVSRIYVVDKFFWFTITKIYGMFLLVMKYIVVNFQNDEFKSQFKKALKKERLTISEKVTGDSLLKKLSDFGHFTPVIDSINHKGGDQAPQWAKNFDRAITDMFTILNTPQTQWDSLFEKIKWLIEYTASIKSFT